MITLQEVEQAALAFSPEERALLAAHLLHSLPQGLEDSDDDELALARQRDAELETDPSIGLTMDQFKAAIAR